MISRFEHSPWAFWTEAGHDERESQRAHLDALVAEYPTWRLGERCVISSLASVHADELSLGDRSYVAASCYLTDRLSIGDDCSINPFSVVRGNVTIGNAVRIGAHTSILGFNHTMEPGIEVFRQPLVSRGIVIGDDVWIGSHVIILDGVTVGDHAVVGAGSVVNRDVEAGAVVVGNPARRVKWRVPPEGGLTPKPLAQRASAFAQRAREQLPDVLLRCWDASAGLFVDRPCAAPTVRAQCDAVELSMLLSDSPPPQRTPDGHRSLLAGFQDPVTGLVPVLGTDGQPAPLDPADGDVAYHVLCVGYALDLLGTGFEHPIAAVTQGDAAGLACFLNDLPWAREAWQAGHWTDMLGTALLWSRRRGDPVPPGWSETLFGWLSTRADPRTGMWGEPTPESGLLQPVNGFYRASRGTMAQFGLPLGHPEAVIDTVLRHARDQRYFAPSSHNACNVLDVAHPLWLTRGSGYRSAEVRALAEELLSAALGRWIDGAGIGFHASGPGGHPDSDPGLQGTEMWLATIWFLADLAGVSDALGYRPCGINRPEPARVESS